MHTTLQLHVSMPIRFHIQKPYAARRCRSRFLDFTNRHLAFTPGVLQDVADRDSPLHVTIKHESHEIDAFLAHNPGYS